MIKLGITGLARSGKSTIFRALTGSSGDTETSRLRGVDQIGVVAVHDERVDTLSSIYRPKKTTYAQIEYLLPAPILSKRASHKEGETWKLVKNCDALIHVVRNFQEPGGEVPQSRDDFQKLEEELILADFMIVEKRLERIESDKKKGRKIDEDEYALLRSSLGILEAGNSLRDNPELASSPLLRGYTFLSAKPVLVLCNNADEDVAFPDWLKTEKKLNAMVVRGALEMELATMSPEDAAEFLTAFDIHTTARHRVIQRSYELLGLISFFTVVEDEVKAWTVKQGTVALNAADVIHSDMKKGFIRAEVVAYDDLIKSGSYQEAKKGGLVRLEGKEYPVADGDVIYFRFNV
jgi:GTP-binding protein YchF